jgi:phosphorylcholine metabolism protein LicD
MKNIILFGASEFGKKALEYYKTKDDINIIAFCDNDIKKHNKFIDNIEIISPKEIKNTNYNLIIITSLYDEEIYKQLTAMGIKKELILIESINTISSCFGQGDKLQMAYELLFFICNLFNKNNIQYHLDHGSLLGITRDASLLPWDKDIDFAMPDTEIEKTVDILKTSLISFNSKYCKNNNWEYVLRNDKSININDDFTIEPITIKIFNNTNEELTDGFDLDIKFKYEHNNKLYWRVGIQTLIADTNICFPSSYSIFKKMKLKVPYNTKKYLTSLYGDWKTPIKEWTYGQYTNIDKNMEK